MNIHPIFVHFPIALLTIYAMFELARLPIITRQTWYNPIKYILLFTGTIFAQITAQTGELAEVLRGRSKLLSVHSEFANISIWIFGLLSIAYLIPILISWTRLQNFVLKYPKLISFLKKVSDILLSISPVLALAGLLAITITGALGGALVYGSTVDPVVSFFYNLLVK